MNRGCVLLVCLAGLLAAESRAEPLQIYIMAGQSNMVGSGLSRYLPREPFDYAQPQPIPFSYDLEIGTYVSQGFELLRPSVKSSTFGSEVTFGRRIDEATQAPFGIIKVAASGTSLSEFWDPDSQDPSHDMYARMINHVQADLSSLGTQGVDYELAGMMWTQGESDTSDERSVAYHDNLVNFLQRVRTDLNDPQLPVYLSRLSQYSTYENRWVIRQAQSDVARADPYTIAVDTDHLLLKFDRVHFTSAGQLGLGEAFADAVLFGPPPEDFEGDGFVGENDLNILVNHWNLSAPAGDTSFGDADSDGFVGLSDLVRVVDAIPPPAPRLDSGDMTGDRYVGMADLNVILTHWNQTVVEGDVTMGDLNVDGFVGLLDLTRLLSQWNKQVIIRADFTPTPEKMDLDGSGAIDEGDLQTMFDQWSFADEYLPVQPIGLDPDPVSADFNADGVVDIEDLRYLLVQLPGGVAPTMAATDAPEDHDGLSLLQIYPGDGMSSQSVASIPEPASMAIFLSLFFGASGRRRGRSR